MGGGFSRASTMRNYVGSTDQYGKASGRPAGSTGLNAADPTSSTGSLAINDVEQNSPEGGGGQVSVAWSAPAIDPFANVTGLSPTVLGGMRSMYTPDALKNASMLQSAQQSLGGGWVWDPAKMQFVAAPQSTTSGGMNFGSGATAMNYGYGS